MKNTAHKLLALLLALTMLLSFFAVAEDGTQAIVGADGPIGLGGETAGEIRDPADGMEIATDAGDGIADRVLDLEGSSDLGLNLDLGANLSLDLDLEGETLETLEGSPTPETEAAGESPETAFMIFDWECLSFYMRSYGGMMRDGEAAGRPTYFKLVNSVEAGSSDEYIAVGSRRHVVLDLSGHTIDRKLKEETPNGFVIEVAGDLTITDSDGEGTITGGKNGGKNGGSGGGVFVKYGGTFTLSGGTISGNMTSYGGGVFVDKGGQFIMDGGMISGNTSSQGSGVYVTNGGFFTMNKGAISDNTTKNYGGGVYVLGVSFTMDGGEISRNTASYGGGVYVLSPDTFIMSGGTISDNTAVYHYGGVYVNDGTFIMKGGTISGNTASGCGGGVYVTNNSKFEMTGASEISKNKTTRSGGGVYVNDGTFDMSGGTISGNMTSGYGGGVYVNYGTFSLSGKVDISDNGKNVVLSAKDKKIKIADKLENSVPIGVSYKDDTISNIDFTTLFSDKMSGKDPADYFASEQIDCEVTLNGTTREAMLAAKVATVTFDKNSDSAKGTMEPQKLQTGVKTALNPNAFKNPGYCFTGWNTMKDGSGTAYADAAKVALTANITLYAQWAQIEVDVQPLSDYPYTGKPVTPKVKVWDKNARKVLVKGKDFTVKYVRNVDAGDQSKAIISFIGDYEGVEAQTKRFEITPKPITVTAEDKTKVQGEVDPELTWVADGLVEGDTLSGKLSREAGEEPGEYKITRGTLSNSNYDISFVPGTLTITTKATPTPTPTATQKPTKTHKPMKTPKPTVKPTKTPKPTKPPRPTATPKPVDPDLTLLARMTVSGDSKTALKIAWTKVKDADGYDIFFAKCGKRFKLKKTVKATASRVVRFKGLDKRKAYKGYVRAWKKVDGKKIYIGKASPQVHAVSGGYTNHKCNTKSVKLNRTGVTLKTGRSSELRAKLTGVKSGMPVLDHVPRVRWYSSNANVATVDANGTVTAVAKGNCTVYAIANNGVRSSAKVKVK